MKGKTVFPSLLFTPQETSTGTFDRGAVREL